MRALRAIARAVKSPTRQLTVITASVHGLLRPTCGLGQCREKNSSGDEIANVNFLR